MVLQANIIPIDQLVPLSQQTMKYPIAKQLSLFAVTLLSAAAMLCGQPNPWQWGTQIGGSGAGMNATRIAVDEAGNSYATGTYTGTAEFGAFTLTSVGDVDIYLVKTDPNGEVVWAASAGGPSIDSANGIAVDADGNVYIAGSYEISAAFGGMTVAAGFGPNAYLAKYSSSGVLQWVRSGSGSESAAAAVALDSAGNPHITGFFTGTGQFGSLSLNSMGASDIFIVAYDSSGVEQWAVRAGGSGFGHQVEGGKGIAVDAAGDVYVGGNFVSFAHFDSITLSAEGDQDAFLAKYSPSAGAWLWARGGGGQGPDFVSDVELDAEGNAYLTGIFTGTAVFDGAPLVAGSGSFFEQAYLLAKYDSDGTAQWIISSAGTGFFAGHDLDVDADGNVYLLATFDGAVTVGGTPLTSAGFDNIYIAKFDTNGLNEWAVHSPGTMYHIAGGIAVDSIGNLYTTGWFLGDITFDETVLQATTTNAFVAAMGRTREPTVEIAEVAFDIHPANIQRKSKGVVPARITAGEDVDLGGADLNSITIWRLDGEGGMVSPSSIKVLPGSRIDLKFKTVELVEGLDLAGVPSGSTVELVISGAVGEGVEFAGVDAVMVR